MYEKDGEKYFVVDGHVHYWDARPENRNKYGAGFINCFYDYHKNLSPEEWVWSKEKYDKYSEEDMMHDLFEVVHVDRSSASTSRRRRRSSSIQTATGCRRRRSCSTCGSRRR